ncbi:MAG: DUF454 family protein [Proteobacteria bacterium]|jgi:uncharacterized membrane protein YbaN (DUF454 family)|nr:DUF454 family protein [Pseudomonadota bacterium]
MNHRTVTRVGPMKKTLYVAIALLCVLLGMIGLLVPVLPGLVFLVIALLLLTRVSRRIQRFAKSDPRFLALSRRLDGFGRVDVVDRFRLGGWMLLDTLVSGLAAAVAMVRRVVPVRSARRDTHG